MGEFSKQTRTALRVYYERGLNALTLMKEDRWDEANEVLKLRKAAYHNFVTAEFLARQAGDPFNDDEWHTLGKLAREVNRQLEVEIQLCQQNAETMLIETRQKREAISKYHSGIKDRSNFESTI